MDILNTYSAINLFLMFAGAIVMGLAKAGLKGIDMLNVTLMALVFGGKASTGIVLPLLCAADIAAVATITGMHNGNTFGNWFHG